MAFTEATELSPREHIIMQADAEERRLAREHAVTLKRLELDITREKNQAQVELKKLESKWSALLRLPSLIIKLPVFLVLALGYIVANIRGNDVSKDYWNYLK